MNWSAALFVLAAGAAGLGFWAFEGDAATIAQVLFVVFLALWVLRSLLHMMHHDQSPTSNRDTYR